MTKRPFTGKGLNAKEQLELIHSDICGLMNVIARSGYEYFVIFIKRNQTSLDMMRSMSSYGSLPSSL